MLARCFLRALLARCFDRGGLCSPGHLQETEAQITIENEDQQQLRLTQEELFGAREQESEIAERLATSEVQFRALLQAQRNHYELGVKQCRVDEAVAREETAQRCEGMLKRVCDEYDESIQQVARAAETDKALVRSLQIGMSKLDEKLFTAERDRALAEERLQAVCRIHSFDPLWLEGGVQAFSPTHPPCGHRSLPSFLPLILRAGIARAGGPRRRPARRSTRPRRRRR